MRRAVTAAGRRVEYTLVQTSRSNVLFKALPEGELKVYAPRYMRLKDIDGMVRDRAPELLEMLDRVEARAAQQRAEHPVSDGSPVMIEGRRYALRLLSGRRVKGELIGNEYWLALPDPEDEDAVRAALRAALSARALARIRERIGYYVPRIGRMPGRVTIREQKTRWGSCSGKGNLNFNWKLIMAPPEVLDYVVIHELCHLYEFNHSPRFWALVAAQMPDYEVWKKWLKAHAEDLSI